MPWQTELTKTPRLTALLDAEERRAAERGDGYLGTEHLLEALVADLDGLAGQILERLGVVDEIRSELERFWSSPARGSLLMADSPPDPAGNPYQVALVSDRPGAPSRLDLGEDGRPQVLTTQHTEDGPTTALEPAPPHIADAALAWQNERDQSSA